MQEQNDPLNKMTREADDLIEEWILDYICYRAWEEFKLSKCLTSPTVDYISALVQQDKNLQGTRRPKVYFLVVLSRLGDGQKCFVDYTDSQELTVLEDMIPIFQNLAHCQTSSLQQEGLGLIHAIKVEALLVCKRSNDIKLEKEVYKRLWSQKDDEEKDNSTSITDFLKNQMRLMRGDSELKDPTYDDFLNRMMKYLKHVQKSFNKPELIKLAETVLTQTSGEMTKKAYAGKKFTKDDFERTSVPETKRKNCDKDYSHSKKQLRKKWNNNVEEPQEEEEAEADDYEEVDAVGDKTEETEEIIKQDKSSIMQELDATLPGLATDRIPTPIDKMTQAQLRVFVPEMMKFSTGRSKIGWGIQACRPIWWPHDVPLVTVRVDVRTDEEKKRLSWTKAQRSIVKNCYRYHEREDLLGLEQDTSVAIDQTVNNLDDTVSSIQIDTGPYDVVTLFNGTQSTVVHSMQKVSVQNRL